MMVNLLEPTPLPTPVRAQRLHVGSPVYNEIVEFLYDEAELLDKLQLGAWSELLAPAADRFPGDAGDRLPAGHGGARLR